MKKTILINGMSCSHCSARVERALCSLDGVTAVSVDLSKGTAIVTCLNSISDKLLRDTVLDLGFEVTDIISDN